MDKKNITDQLLVSILSFLAIFAASAEASGQVVAEVMLKPLLATKSLLRDPELQLKAKSRSGEIAKITELEIRTKSLTATVPLPKPHETPCGSKVYHALEAIQGSHKIKVSFFDHVTRLCDDKDGMFEVSLTVIDASTEVTLGQAVFIASPETNYSPLPGDYFKNTDPLGIQGGF